MVLFKVLYDKRFFWRAARLVLGILLNLPKIP